MGTPEKMREFQKSCRKTNQELQWRKTLVEDDWETRVSGNSRGRLWWQRMEKDYDKEPTDKLLLIFRQI